MSGRMISAPTMRVLHPFHQYMADICNAFFISGQPRYHIIIMLMCFSVDYTCRRAMVQGVISPRSASLICVRHMMSASSTGLV